MNNNPERVPNRETRGERICYALILSGTLALTALAIWWAFHVMTE